LGIKILSASLLFFFGRSKEKEGKKEGKKKKGGASACCAPHAKVPSLKGSGYSSHRYTILSALFEKFCLKEERKKKRRKKGREKKSCGGCGHMAPHAIPLKALSSPPHPRPCKAF